QLAPPLARLDFALRLAGSGERALLRQAHERVDLRLLLRNARERRLGHFDRRELLVLERCGDLPKFELEHVRHLQSSHCARKAAAGAVSPRLAASRASSMAKMPVIAGTSSCARAGVSSSPASLAAVSSICESTGGRAL